MNFNKKAINDPEGIMLTALRNSLLTCFWAEFNLFRIFDFREFIPFFFFVKL